MLTKVNFKIVRLQNPHSSPSGDFYCCHRQRRKTAPSALSKKSYYKLWASKSKRDPESLLSGVNMEAMAHLFNQKCFRWYNSSPEWEY